MPSYLIINPNTTALVTERLKGLAIQQAPHLVVIRPQVLAERTIR